MARSGAVTFKGTPLTLAGEAVKVGQQAPDFTIHYFEGGLKTIKLADLKGKPSFISVVPSLDTPVCQTQTKKFNAIARLQPREHLYLFSRRSLRELFGRLGVEHVVFEPALFARYDMFAMVSSARAIPLDPAEVERVLNDGVSARLVQALLDLGETVEDVKRLHAESSQRVGELESACNELGAEVKAFHLVSVQTAELKRVPEKR